MTYDGSLVVDASVAVKWLVREHGSTAAHALRTARLHAPTLLRVEVGNALRTLARRGDLSEDDARAAFDHLLAAPVHLHDPSPALLAGALDLALRLDHPIYDCLYLALAIEIGAPLVTADGRFHRAAAGRAEFGGPSGIVRTLGTSRAGTRRTTRAGRFAA